MAAEKIILSLITDAVTARKDIDKVSDSTKDAKKQTTLWGQAMGGVKKAMLAVKSTSKVLFGSIKAGLLSTGIGAFVVIIGSMVQYFKDSEDGAGKLKQILAQVGVVVGNITDIVSNLGKAFFNLLTGNFSDFKASLGEAVDQVKNFGTETKKEMAVANQLEKDRLALQKFERAAQVDKAKTEAEIMKLRLQARDDEKFSNEERLQFMRQANKLADEQLQKDLHVAQEKLRFQQVENSYSKSTQQNLDDEAALEAEVFRIQKANFSERKRMKSEEQALVREKAAEDKAIAAQAKKDAEDKRKQEEADAKAKQERVKASNIKLRELAQANALAEIEDQFDRAAMALEFAEEKELEGVDGMENAEALKTEIKKKYTKQRTALVKAEKEMEMKMETEALKGLQSTLGNAASMAGEGTKAWKAMKTAEAMIGMITGAQQAYNSTVGIPFVGPVIAPINAALALAAGMKSVQAIQSTPIPETKARGGVIRGYGSGTSDSIPARLSRGEVVINAKSAKAFRPILSNINVAGGGVGFARGGATTPDMGRALDMMAPEPVKAYVITDEMTNSQSRLNKIRRKASV